ncbi:YHS domain-containing protein [Desulfoferrobacter suflitae]|uniref:YHS domain-containing protein n=1 Tax=Desulfoferrobacter suflitae TaxID=2865782 RepID=UPI00216443D0|nr:YHS domain-containing protein [Desulfoferrobacter suflitae]MCK8602858.1 YHS domain-containing protein [Desulfoferrobacter suflitae]
MKRWIALSLLLLFTVAFAVNPVLALQKAAEGEPQTICPVMGGAIDKNVYVDYQGKRVYFCCESCKEQFMQEPEKYMEKLEAQGVTLEKSPVQ